MTGNGKKKSRPRWRADRRLAKSFALAARLHAGQVRKGTDIPYISHLMAVSSMVTQYGGSDVQAAAGLLHDSIEDTKQTHRTLSRIVGKRVADIVRDCSDDDGTGTSNDKARLWTEIGRAHV